MTSGTFYYKKYYAQNGKFVVARVTWFGNERVTVRK